MNRHKIINDMIAKRGYKSYFEIGVGKKFSTYKKIVCDKKAGIDAFEDNEWYNFNKDNLPEGIGAIKSDDFFAINSEKFDIFFVDGLHHKDQVLKDMLNCLDCLNPGGTILVDDVNPINEQMQAVPRSTKIWTGDVWKAWVELRATKSLKMAILDVEVHGGPYGIGIIRKGKQAKLKGVDVSNLTYSDLDANRVEYLNLIDLDTYLEKWQ